MCVFLCVSRKLQGYQPTVEKKVRGRDGLCCRVMVKMMTVIGEGGTETVVMVKMMTVNGEGGTETVVTTMVVMKTGLMMLVVMVIGEGDTETVVIVKMMTVVMVVMKTVVMVKDSAWHNTRFRKKILGRSIKGSSARLFELRTFWPTLI